MTLGRLRQGRAQERRCVRVRACCDSASWQVGSPQPPWDGTPRSPPMGPPSLAPMGLGTPPLQPMGPFAHLRQWLPHPMGPLPHRTPPSHPIGPLPRVAGRATGAARSAHDRGRHARQPAARRLRRRPHARSGDAHAAATLGGLIFGAAEACALPLSCITARASRMWRARYASCLERTCASGCDGKHRRSRARVWSMSVWYWVVVSVTLRLNVRMRIRKCVTEMHVS